MPTWWSTWMPLCQKADGGPVTCPSDLVNLHTKGPHPPSIQAPYDPDMSALPDFSSVGKEQWVRRQETSPDGSTPTQAGWVTLSRFPWMPRAAVGQTEWLTPSVDEAPWVIRGPFPALATRPSRPSLCSGRPRGVWGPVSPHPSRSHSDPACEVQLMPIRTSSSLSSSPFLPSGPHPGVLWSKTQLHNLSTEGPQEIACQEEEYLHLLGLPWQNTRPGGQNNRNVVLIALYAGSPASQDWALSPWLWEGRPSPHGLPSVPHIPGLSSSSYQDTCHIVLGTLMTAFKLSYLFKGPVSQNSPTVG